MIKDTKMSYIVKVTIIISLTYLLLYKTVSLELSVDKKKFNMRDELFFTEYLRRFKYKSLRMINNNSI